MRRARSAVVSGRLIGALILTTALVACGGKGGDQPAPEPEPTAPSEPAPTEPTPEPATVAAEPDAGAAAAPSDPATAAPTGETVAAGDGDATGGAAENAADAELGFVYPAKNTVIRDVDPESIEGVIQRALMAAANPDEEKGWKDFESLLHSQEKGEMSLRSRKQYNWPAMRRKAYLFLIEGTDKNVYKWAYAEEHDEGKTIKVFVYNPKSSPTPCYVKRDPEQENHWRITTCSL